MISGQKIAFPDESLSSNIAEVHFRKKGETHDKSRSQIGTQPVLGIPPDHKNREPPKDVTSLWDRISNTQKRRIT
jgi:hypothetical protein